MEMGDASHCGTITFLIKEGERWSLRLYLFPVLLVCFTAWCRFLLSLLPLALKKGVGFPHVLVLQLSLSFLLLAPHILRKRNCILKRVMFADNLLDADGL